MAGKRNKKALYSRPPPIPKGEVITDISTKKTWKLGVPVGVGGFGDIYSASSNNDSKGTYNFVVKVEPHENGPLFVEKNFYIRNATEKDIKDYMKANKLTSLGMPTYYGQGSHETNGHKYRYLVLERYGMNVWELFEQCNKSFSPVTTFLLGVQILEVLKYIHEHGYVHADIKGGNILMGRRKGTENQAYLVDFGLATRLTDKEYKPDPKSAHNGTLEYTSRDAHKGGPTMRGDLEILAYNMLQWITGTLPWLQKINEKTKKQNIVPNAVMKMKIDFMENVRNNIKRDYPNVPEALIKFFEYINTLKEMDVPDYAKCQKIFLDYLKSVGKNKNSKLEFKPNNTTLNNNGDIGAHVDDTEENDSNHVVKKRSKRAKANTEHIEDSQTETPNVYDTEENDSNHVVKKRGKRAKANTEDIEHSQTETPNVYDTEENDSNHVIKKRGKRAKANTEDIEDSQTETANVYDTEENDSNYVVKKRGKKVKANTEDIEDSQTETPAKVKKSASKAIAKRKIKSVDPQPVVELKRLKMSEMITPPAKKNHANIATQTSEGRRSPRQVSFDSPISEVLGEKPTANGSRSVNSSQDIFEDSIEEKKKVKKKRKLLATKEITVKRVVRRKVTTAKGKSWKDAPAVVNGRSPQK